MLESEALVIYAAIQAAFPRGADREETRQLYAGKLLRYDAAQAERAVHSLIDTRTDPWLPTWAELRNEIVRQRPRLRELEEPLVPPDPETLRRIAELQAQATPKPIEAA